MKVVIFDSGAGGSYVYERAKARFPAFDFTLVTDNAGMPYGDKTVVEMLKFASRALGPHIRGADIVIVACHSLSMNAIDELRAGYPKVTFIGFDVAVKLAAHRGHRRIVVCATPASLKSERYQRLKADCNFEAVYEPDCSDWAQQIEEGSFDVQTAVDSVRGLEISAVVLGCTHYFWIAEQLRTALRSVGGLVEVIEPTDYVLDELDRFIADSVN